MQISSNGNKCRACRARCRIPGDLGKGCQTARSPTPTCTCVYDAAGRGRPCVSPPYRERTRNRESDDASFLCSAGWKLESWTSRRRLGKVGAQPSRMAYRTAGSSANVTPKQQTKENRRTAIHPKLSALVPAIRLVTKDLVPMNHPSGRWPTLVGSWDGCALAVP